MFFVWTTCGRVFYSSDPLISIEMPSLLDPLTKRSQIMIFSTGWCPFCHKVKDIFRSKNLDFNEYLIDESTAEGSAVRAEIKEKFKHATVPAVFIKGEFVGGFDDVQALNDQGKLKL